MKKEKGFTYHPCVSLIAKGYLIIQMPLVHDQSGEK